MLNDQSALECILKFADELYSMYRIVKIEFSKEITALCKQRQNLEISKNDFCQQLENFIRLNLRYNFLGKKSQASQIKEIHEQLENFWKRLVID